MGENGARLRVRTEKAVAVVEPIRTQVGDDLGSIWQSQHLVGVAQTASGLTAGEEGSVKGVLECQGMGMEVITDSFLSFPWAGCVPHVTHLALRKKCHPFGERRGKIKKKVICGRARTCSEITLLSLTIPEY